MFDRWLVDGAVDHGAELRTSTKVTGITRHDGGWRVEANGQTIDTRIVIGADGPASFVARQAGLVRSLERIGAYEYRFRREDVPLLDPQFFLLYIGEAYKGGYAWIFPKGDSVNVGAGGHIDAHAATVDFCRKFGIDVDRKTQTIAGSIPSRDDLTALAAPGLAIAGDAAGSTYPLNGDGRHPRSIRAGVYGAIPPRVAHGGRELSDPRGHSCRTAPRRRLVRGDGGDRAARVRGWVGDPRPRGRLPRDRRRMPRHGWAARPRSDLLPGRGNDRVAGRRRADHADGLTGPESHRPPVGPARRFGARHPQRAVPLGRPADRGERERREGRLRPEHGGNDRDVPRAAGCGDPAGWREGRAGAEGVHRRGRGSLSRLEGGVVRQAPREGDRRGRLRPDPRRLRRRGVRGMDAPRPERVAPRKGVHPRGRHPLEVRQDGAIHGRETRCGRAEAHPGPHGTRAESEGGGSEHRGADDQSPQENRMRPRGPPHADRVGGSRARHREASGPAPSSRSEAVSGLSRGVAIPFTEDLIAFSPLPPGNRDGIPPPGSLQRFG